MLALLFRLSLLLLLDISCCLPGNEAISVRLLFIMSPMDPDRLRLDRREKDGEGGGMWPAEGERRRDIAASLRCLSISETEVLLWGGTGGGA